MHRPLGLIFTRPERKLRLLRFSKYVASNLPTPPATVDWTAAASKNWGQFLNNSIGDCGIATPCHMMQAWTANNGAEVTVPDQAALDAYIAVTGQEGAAYDPTTGVNDNGTNPVDVLDYWRNTGIGGRKIIAYLAVNPQNQQELMEATWLFGGVYLGVDLPASAQYQIQNGQPWDRPNRLPLFGRRLWQPGSWGGHAVPIERYDSTGVGLITWGAMQPASWVWLAYYCQEAYAVLSEDWAASGKLSPSNFDLEALKADLAALNG